MKSLFGAVIITSIIGVGAYYYLASFSGMVVGGYKSATPASISNALQEDPQKEEATTKKEEVKKLPDLDSLEGLEEESSDLFNGAEGFPSQGGGDPLKDASQ